MQRHGVTTAHPACRGPTRSIRTHSRNRNPLTGCCMNHMRVVHSMSDPGYAGSACSVIMVASATMAWQPGAEGSGVQLSSGGSHAAVPASTEYDGLAAAGPLRVFRDRVGGGVGHLAVLDGVPG